MWMRVSEIFIRNTFHGLPMLLKGNLTNLSSVLPSLLLFGWPLLVWGWWKEKHESSTLHSSFRAALKDTDSQPSRPGWRAGRTLGRRRGSMSPAQRRRCGYGLSSKSLTCTPHSSRRSSGSLCHPDTHRHRCPQTLASTWSCLTWSSQVVVVSYPGENNSAGTRIAQRSWGAGTKSLNHTEQQIHLMSATRQEGRRTRPPRTYRTTCSLNHCSSWNKENHIVLLKLCVPDLGGKRTAHFRTVLGISSLNSVTL